MPKTGHGTCVVFDPDRGEDFTLADFSTREHSMLVADVEGLDWLPHVEKLQAGFDCYSGDAFVAFAPWGPGAGEPWEPGAGERQQRFCDRFAHAVTVGRQSAAPIRGQVPVDDVLKLREQIGGATGGLWALGACHDSSRVVELLAARFSSGGIGLGWLKPIVAELDAVLCLDEQSQSTLVCRSIGRTAFEDLVTDLGYRDEPEGMCVWTASRLISLTERSWDWRFWRR